MSAPSGHLTENYIIRKFIAVNTFHPEVLSLLLYTLQQLETEPETSYIREP